MQIEILTKEELLIFKSELIRELTKVIKPNEVPQEKWLTSSIVRKLLNISSTTLQNLRIKGILTYQKVNNTFYYARTDVIQLLGEISNP